MKFPPAIFPDTPADEYPDVDAVTESIRERARNAPKPPERDLSWYQIGLDAARKEERP